MKRSGQSARWEDTEFCFRHPASRTRGEKSSPRCQAGSLARGTRVRDSGCLELHYVEAMEVDKLTEGEAITSQGKRSATLLLQRATKKRGRKAAPREHPHLVGAPPSSA